MKLTTKQVKPGMEFQLINEKEIDYFAEMKVDASGRASFDYSNVPNIGDVFETTSGVYTKNVGGPSVNWINKRTGDTGTMFWGPFRNCTQYIGGTAPGSTGVVVTSTGPFNGFDIQVKSHQIQQEPGSSMEIVIAFEGTFTGGKKVTTKMINGIKKSPGFDVELKNLLSAPVHQMVDNALFQPEKPQPDWPQWLGYSSYVGGNVEFLFYLHDDVATTVANIHRFVDRWVLEKNTQMALLDE